MPPQEHGQTQCKRLSSALWRLYPSLHLGMIAGAFLRAHPCASVPLAIPSLVVGLAGVVDLLAVSTRIGAAVLGRRLCTIPALGTISTHTLADLRHLGSIVQ